MALKRYMVWDKQSKVYTPSGEVFTAEEWIARYPIFAEDWSIPVISQPPINGGYCGELTQMKNMYAQQGAEFTDGMTNDEILETIEAFEDLMNTPSSEPSAETRIADALEYQNMMVE